MSVRFVCHSDGSVDDADDDAAETMLAFETTGAAPTVNLAAADLAWSLETEPAEFAGPRTHRRLWWVAVPAACVATGLLVIAATVLLRENPVRPAPAALTGPSSTTVIQQEPTVIMQPPTVTVPPSTVTQPPSTVTEPPTTVTEPPSTVTEPPSTITEPPSTVTVRPYPTYPTYTPTYTPPPVIAPDPAGQDQAFLGRLRAGGFVIWNPALIISRAHEICGLFQQGYPTRQVEDEMNRRTNSNDSYSVPVVTAAQQSYPNCYYRDGD